MKKKILAFTLVIAMLAICFGATYAYFTDIDEAKNVMVIGEVDIEQTEWQRDEDGNFEAFEQGKDMFPGVYENGSAALTKVYFNQDGTLNIADGAAWCGMWSESAEQYNAIDKIVVVQNTGKNDVYYRTLIAIESPDGQYTGSWDPNAGNADLIFNYNDNNRFEWSFNIGTIEVDGVKYVLHEALYKEVLAPEEMSRPSLLQLMFTKETTQADVAAFGETLDILCVTQAVQTAGFADANTALDAAFGDITTTNHPWN